MLTFKYFLANDGQYLVIDNLQTSGEFVHANKYRPPSLFPSDTKIENIFPKILGNDVKISDIYEKYLEL